MSAAATMTSNPATTDRRSLRFETSRDIAIEINRLRHGGYTQRDQRTGCDRIRQRGQHWCERRLIGRSPVEVLAADGQHVHLVEPVAITECACNAMQYHSEGRDRENHRCGER